MTTKTTKTTTEPTFKTWDEYVAEAAHEPYVIPVNSRKKVTIPAPTAHQVTQFNRSARAGDPEAMLISLCGETWPEVEELLSKVNHKVAENLLADLAMYFDVTEEVTLVGPGGTPDKPGPVVKTNDPRRIGQLLNAGYVPMGEAVSRT